MTLSVIEQAGNVGAARGMSSRLNPTCMHGPSRLGSVCRLPSGLPKTSGQRRPITCRIATGVATRLMLLSRTLLHLKRLALMVLLLLRRTLRRRAAVAAPLD